MNRTCTSYTHSDTTKTLRFRANAPITHTHGHYLPAASAADRASPQPTHTRTLHKESINQSGTWPTTHTLTDATQAVVLAQAVSAHNPHTYGRYGKTCNPMPNCDPTTHTHQDATGCQPAASQSETFQPQPTHPRTLRPTRLRRKRNRPTTHTHPDLTIVVPNDLNEDDPQPTHTRTLQRRSSA